MGSRRKYSAEFERDAVKLLEAKDRPVGEVAKSLGVDRSTLRSRQRAIEQEGEPAFPGNGRPRTASASGAVCRGRDRLSAHDGAGLHS